MAQVYYAKDHHRHACIREHDHPFTHKVCGPEFDPFAEEFALIEEEFRAFREYMGLEFLGLRSLVAAMHEKALLLAGKMCKAVAYDGVVTEDCVNCANPGRIARRLLAADG